MYGVVNARGIEAQLWTRLGCLKIKRAIFPREWCPVPTSVYLAVLRFRIIARSRTAVQSCNAALVARLSSPEFLVHGSQICGLFSVLCEPRVKPLKIQAILALLGNVVHHQRVVQSAHGVRRLRGANRAREHAYEQ